MKPGDIIAAAQRLLKTPSAPKPKPLAPILEALESEPDLSLCCQTISLLSEVADPALSERARLAVSAFWRKQNPANLPSLAQKSRGYYYSISLKQVPAILGESPDQNLVGFLSMNGSGYVREEACKRLEARAGGLGYLLLRLNDWVHEVREVATRKLDEDFEFIAPGDWVHNLRLVLRLEYSGRASTWTPKGPPCRAFVKRVKQRLERPDALPALMTYSGSPDRTIRRSAHYLALKAHPDKFALLRQVLDSEDVLLRSWALREMERHLTSEEQIRLARSALGNRSQRVRQRALRAWMRLCPDDHGPLTKALLDSHHCVRALARYYHPEENFRELYLSQLPERPMALLALAEVDANCQETLLEYCSGYSSAHRHKALECLNHVGYPDVDFWMELLASDDPKDSRLAKESLQKLRSFQDSKVEELLDKSELSHVRRNAFLILVQRGRLLEQVLRCLPILSRDESLLGFVEEFLAKRYGSTTRAATGGQVREWRQCRDSYTELLSQQSLEFLDRIFR